MHPVDPVYERRHDEVSFHVDRMIDWKRYKVWIDESEIDDVGERVSQFHAALSPDSFRDLQQECRRLWEEWP